MTSSPSNDPIDPEIRITTQDERIDRISLIVDGVEVSWALVTGFDLGFGQSTIRMLGIGGVETEESHRNKGYSRRVLQATVRFVERSDAPLLTLFGIPDYYHRFGFLPLGPDYNMKFRQAETLPAFDPAFSVRTAHEADLPAIQEIWRIESRGLNGHVIRHDRQDSWKRLRESITTGRNDCRVVTDGSGTVQGYAWLVSHHWAMEGFREDGRNNLDVGEAGATSWQAADAVLAMLRVWRDEAGKNDILLAIPPRHNSIGRAAQLRDVDAEHRFHFNEDYMGRSTGSGDLFQALLPELNARWQAAGSCWQGNIDFLIGEERTRLAFGEGISIEESSGTADSSLTMTPGEIARLVFCSYAPDDLLLRSGADEHTVDVVSKLFPQQATYIYPADRF